MRSNDSTGITMNIIISDDQQIGAICEEFSSVFPYLKLEFFGKPGLAHLQAINAFKVTCKTLAELRSKGYNRRLVLSPGMTVADLEQGFKSAYGLLVQVYRKSGKAWLGTTVTDGWTLEEQNLQGEALSKVF